MPELAIPLDSTIASMSWLIVPVIYSSALLHGSRNLFG
jgi:hypothetical protein